MTVDRPKKTGQFGKGNPGKPKGATNHLTRSVKEAIERAFEQVGGADYLVAVAQSDPKTFCALLGKLVPLDVKADVGGGGIVFQVVRKAKGE